VLIEIREERSDDVAAVREVNRRAFGQDQESNIVDALRTNGGALLSLVATVNGQVAGHIMYSPLTVADNVNGVGLGPMAVVPEYQRRGIGTKLIEAGNRKIKDAGYPFIIVVGHAQYYPRFGVRPAIELELSTNGIFRTKFSCCWFSTKRKCRVHLDSRSIGTNFRLYLEHLCQSEPAMPCKIFFCPRIKRNDAERNEFVFVYFCGSWGNLR
jgi:Predicted acetyltransferase